MAICPIDSGQYSGSCTVCWKIGGNVATDQGGLEAVYLSFGSVAMQINYNHGGDIIESTYDENGRMSSKRYLTYSVSFSQIMEPDGSMPPYGGEPNNTVRYLIPENGEPPTIARLNFSWTSDESQLRMTAIANPIVTSSEYQKAVTHAKEQILVDEWDSSAGYTTGSHDTGWMKKKGAGMSLLVNIVVDPDEWGELSKIGGNKYAVWVEGITFCGQLVDMSDASPRKFKELPGYTPYDGLYVEGTSNGTVGFWGPNYQGGPWVFDAYSFWIRAPYTFDFSGIHYKWMDGTECDPEIYCSALRKLSRDGKSDIGPWKGRASELRALGTVRQKSGFHSMSDNAPDMSPEVRIWMDRHATSLGIELGLPPAEYRVKDAGWLAEVDAEGNILVSSPLDGDYSEDGEFGGNPKYVSPNGFYLWWKESVNGYAMGLAPGGQAIYEQWDGGPEGIYMYGDLPNEPIDPDTGLGPLDPMPYVDKISGSGIISTSSPSFGHDATFIFEGWTLLNGNRTDSGRRDDILSAWHGHSINIYAEAHDHTDWVGTNVTTPDVNGNFTVNQAGGKLKLELASNYIARQGKVGQENQVECPTSYWIRKHDGCLGRGTPAEEHEAIYCAMGWGYYATSFIAPEFCDITCKIEFYDDVGGVSDNHFSSGKRQTGYSYSPGELHSLEKTITLIFKYQESDGYPTLVDWSPVLVDLMNENVLTIVKSIEWTFGAAGEWRMGEHNWSRDFGDRQEATDKEPFYRVAPADATAVKFFENWRYAEGGASGHFDGMAKRQLWQHDNIKGNAIEKTCGYFNVVFGEKSGFDFTTCLSVGGWAGLATAATDAWVFNYNAGAEEACMKDSEDNVFKGLSCYDIVPVMHGGVNGAVPVVPRCGMYRAVNGLVYAFRGTQYVGGRVHGTGWTLGDNPKRARFKRLEPILRRAEHDPVLPWDTFQFRVLSDWHGHYHSHGGEVIVPSYNAGTPHYEYGRLNDDGSEVVAGRMATREWTYLDLNAMPMGKPFIQRDAVGNPISMTCEDEGVVTAFYFSGDVGNKMRAKPFTDGNHVWSSIAVGDKGGWVYVAATNTLTNSTDIKISKKGGTEWSDNMATLGADLRNGTIAERFGQVYLTGWKDNNIYLTVSTKDDLSREILDGTNTLITVCNFTVANLETDEPPRSSVTVKNDGSIFVAVGGDGNMEIYKCNNYKNAFTIIDA